MSDPTPVSGTAPVSANPVTAAVAAAESTVKADVAAAEVKAESFISKVKSAAVKYGIPVAAFVAGALVGHVA
jgi:hypothetical protein